MTVAPFRHPAIQVVVQVCLLYPYHTTLYTYILRDAAIQGNPLHATEAVPLPLPPTFNSSGIITSIWQEPPTQTVDLLIVSTS